MAHITNKLRGMVAAFVAVFAALALVPGVAMATPASSNSLEISGFENGSKVTVYKVVQFDYKDVSGTYDWNFTADFGIDKGTYGDASDAATFADTMATAIHNETASLSPVYDRETDSPVTIPGLDPGQYLVLVEAADGSTVIYQNAVATVGVEQEDDGDWISKAGTVNMKIKSIKAPHPDKTINGSEVTSDYKVGDSVPFVVTVAVPQYPDSYTNKTFNMSDLMSEGLDFDASSLKVYAVGAGADGADLLLEAGTHYTLDSSATDDYTFKVTFDYDEISAYSNLRFEYSAKLNTKAFVDNIDNNKVTVEYSNGTSTNTTFDETKVYTYQIDVTKVDADNNETKLEGATFDVYIADENGSETITVNGAAVNVTKLHPVDHSTDGAFTTGSNGALTIDGLKAGTYYLIETAAPEGYQIDKTPLEVVVPASTDGSKLSIERTIKNTKDLPGLPTTGGAGTVALTAAGVVLIAGAAAFIVRSRKQN